MKPPANPSASVLLTTAENLKHTHPELHKRFEAAEKEFHECMQIVYGLAHPTLTEPWLCIADAALKLGISRQALTKRVKKGLHPSELKYWSIHIDPATITMPSWATAGNHGLHTSMGVNRSCNSAVTEEARFNAAPEVNGGGDLMAPPGHPLPSACA